MSNNHLEDTLNRLANEPVPADVHKLAEKTSQDFSQTLNQSGQQVHVLWEYFMRSRIAKLAIAAAIVIVAAIGLTQLLPSGIAWADVVEPLLNASTAILDIIIGQEDANAPIIHDEILGSRIRRTMSSVSDDVSIIDLEQARIMSLTLSKKQATYIDLKGLPSIPNYFEHLRNVIGKLQESPDFVVEKLGERQIDGQRAVGFCAKHPEVTVTIWADPKTAMPIRIEQQEKQMLVVCKNIRFNVPMDKSMFSMDVPEGFTRQQMDLDLLGATEQDFIEGLRLRAEIIGDGWFPEDVSVEAYIKQAPLIGQKIEQLKLTEQQQLDLGKKLAQHLLFIRFFKGDGPWHYAGKGVRLGDKDKAIFWYRPKGSQTYRVIYGDLTVKDVLPENLPK